MTIEIPDNEIEQVEAAIREAETQLMQMQNRLSALNGIREYLRSKMPKDELPAPATEAKTE